LGYWYQDNVNSSFSHTATYTFDGVNRLKGAVATGNSTYNLSFIYTSDGSNGQYGNMTCTAGSCKDLTFSPSTNQITASGYTYDAAGDLTEDSSNSTVHNYQWDAEGRVSKVDSGSTWGFTYDGVGDRAQWANSGGDAQHLFDPAGKWLGVAGSYSLVWLGGRQMAVYTSSATAFNHVNNLNSTTMYTNQAGAAVGDQAFYPWGDAWLYWGVDGYNFASLDYYDTSTTTALTPFRVFSPNIGRWHSPDPAPADLTNPQSLNRYAYVLNNPTTLTDPTGLCGETYHYTMTDSQGNVLQELWAEGEPCEEQSQSNHPGDPGWFDPPPISDLPLGSAPDISSPTTSYYPPQQPANNCHENRIMADLGAVQFTGYNANQGGHQEFGISTNADQLTALRFHAYSFAGLVKNGFRPNSYSVFWSYHINGINGQIGPGDPLGWVQIHNDVFNPDSGLLGILGHAIWDLGIGSLIFGHSSALDPGC
jgi:RHS repeat-associated protein